MNERSAVQARPPRPALPQEPPPPDTGATGRPGPFCRNCLPWLVRRRRLVLSVALVVGLAGAFFSARLYMNLRSGFEELLPDNAPSVVAARTIAPKLHNVTHLSVIVEGAHGDALDRFADDLAARLRKLPDDIVESVEYRTDQQEAFLRRFGGLYLTVDELDSIQQRLDARIAWEKRKANPLTHLLDDEEDDPGPAPALDFDDIAQKYGAVNGALSQFRKGYFQTPDGHLLVLLVRPPESATGLGANQRVLDAVKKEVQALQPTRYDASMKVGYDGEVATLVEEQAALEADLVSSTAVVVTPSRRYRSANRTWSGRPPPSLPPSGTSGATARAEASAVASDTINYNLNLYHFAWALSKPTSNVLFWVVTVVNAPRDIPEVRLAIGSNAASVWWLNGEEVIGIYNDRQTVIDDGVSKRLTLRKGPNIIRAAVINGGGATDFCARFIDEEGKPVKDFTVSLDAGNR